MLNDSWNPRFMTGDLPDDIPEMSEDEDEKSFEATGAQDQESLDEATNSLLSSNASVPMGESDNEENKQQR